MPGGVIEEYTYTNSLEAIEESISEGYEILEIDMQLSADNKMICVHNWEQWMSMTGKDEKDVYIPTEEEFKKELIYGQYKPLNFIDVMNFLAVHKNIYVMLDTKELETDIVNEQYTYIMNTLRENNHIEILDQLLIPIYNKEMYETLDALIGDKGNYFYTSYMSSEWDGSDLSLIRLCKWMKDRTNIGYFEVSQNSISPTVIRILRRYELIPMIFTVNEIEDVQKYFEMGVDYIETDYVRPEDIRAINKVNKTS